MAHKKWHLIPSVCWPRPKEEKKKSTKPCIIENLCDQEAFEAYEPAFREAGVVIPLAESKQISFPLSAEEVVSLKAGLRYVWCDGYESAEWKARDCKYLGIRITDSFVLHETVVVDWFAFVFQYREKCHSRKITLDELRLVDIVWDEVSAMRVKAEDMPLPDFPFFWIQEPEDRYYVHAKRDGSLHHRYREDIAVSLTAVTND